MGYDINSKVELLAPAGNYESFLGAIHAGADAVYLAGQKFGARAYADNFSEEELCRAIRYAHLYDKKVYLTLNTLVKEKEFSDIYSYLNPYYQEGLDGIIIQDLGVLKYVKEVFPGLLLHISTQAMVTGPAGASFLKEQGAVRVVPARELSLEEIRNIKEQTGLEMETFIHGAMCYCYSGQCLFSSIAGGRSGNRGRCAQPCRLPYQLKVNGKTALDGEVYPLSLKDMCTIQHIPELIMAGIDSFKIEGRMKKPEYTAGVTSIYRKYIDRFYDNPGKYTETDSDDLRKLSSLYIRSGVQNGYYFRHNGREMITLNSPAYSGSDEMLLNDIRREFLIPEKKIDIDISLYCHVGEPISLTMYLSDKPEYCVVSEGPIIEKASKQPVEKDILYEKISKLGNTFFSIRNTTIELGNNCFIPMKTFNELRRDTVLRLEDAILKQKNNTLKRNLELCDYDELQYKDIKSLKGISDVTPINCGYSVLVTTIDQLKACIEVAQYIRRIYIESELVFGNETHNVTDIINYLNADTGHLEIYIALPFVIRLKDSEFLSNLKKFIQDNRIDGCLLRNVEELGLFKQGMFSDINIKLATDAGLYCFQSMAVKQYSGFATSVCLPYELNRAEKKNLMGKCEDTLFEQVIYGRVPMMITANCLEKTSKSCTGKKSTIQLIDRYKHEFPVQNICRHCYNIIWNCMPLSLHARLDDYHRCIKRLQFTTESADITAKILDFFINGKGEFPVKEYTTGHEKRGVE